MLSRKSDPEWIFKDPDEANKLIRNRRGLKTQLHQWDFMKLKLWVPVVFGTFFFLLRIKRNFGATELKILLSIDKMMEEGGDGFKRLKMNERFS